MEFISVNEYLMGRIKMADLSDEQVANMNTLIPKVNMFLEKFGEKRAVNSGYRSPEINASSGGAKKSKHMICAAVDLEDKDARLYNFARANEGLLKEIGLWCEERQGGWLHMQCIPPKSGRRFYLP
jgi:uncharacterized protein YcbK (DUF882 family)